MNVSARSGYPLAQRKNVRDYEVYQPYNGAGAPEGGSVSGWLAHQTFDHTPGAPEADAPFRPAQ